MANNGKETPGAASGKPATKELSMEARLGIAFALMTAVLFLTPYFVKTPPAQQTNKQAAQPKPVEASKPAAESAPAPAAAPGPVPAGQISAAAQDDHIVIDTDVYSVRFSNKGAVVRSWVLKKYKDQQNHPVELVNSKGGEALGFPFSMIPKGNFADPGPNRVLYKATKSEDGLGVTFEYADTALYARKTFQFEKNRYRLQVTSEAREQGRPAPHSLGWRGGFGDFSVLNTLSTQKTLYYANASNKLISNDVSAAKNGTLIEQGSYRFAGISDTYFTAVALPSQGQNLDVSTWSDKLIFAAENKEMAHIGVSVGGDGANRLAFFVGPKDPEILKAEDPRLEQVIDYGWFELLAKPLFAALHYVEKHYTHNWGWAIVLVTVIINVLLLPLKISNIKSMKKMAELQPQIKAIQKRYEHLSMRDPKRQEQQAETMDLYKKHGVNPLGGCLPMLLQLPFFFAFYNVLSVAIELRGAPWLWVGDLSQPETLAVRILPLATVATQFLMQKMTPTTTMDPQQQRIMMMMPLMFVFVFYGVASGLVLYWLTSNVVGIVQQWGFNKTMHTAPVSNGAAPAAAGKKSGKK